MHQNRILCRLLPLCWTTYVVAYLCRLNLSTVLDKLSDGLGVSLEYLGAVSSFYFISYAVGQLVNGFLGDRVNPRRFLMVALVMTGTINVIVSVQSSGALLMLLWGINGFCQSMFWSTLLRLLSFYTTDAQRKNVSTIMATCAVTGYLLSWVVLGYLFRPCDYPPYFWVPGILALLLVPFWFFTERNPAPPDGTLGRSSAPPLLQTAREFIHDRLFLVCLLCLTIGAIQEGAIFWLPMIFTNVLGWGSDSLLYLILVPFAKLAGVFLARGIVSLFQDNVRRAMLTTLSVTFGISALLVLTSHHPSFLTVVLISCLIAAINASNWYTVSYFPLFFAHRNIVSTLVGTFDFSTYTGASIMSGLLGVLLLKFGWSALTLLWLVLSAVALLLTFGGAGRCLARRGVLR